MRLSSPRRAGVAALVVAVIVSLLPATAAAAIGQPVVIDDFNGATFGTRSVSYEGSGSTFSVTGGRGVFSTRATQADIGAVNLTYSSESPVDLTAGGSNTQLLIELDSVQRTSSSAGETAGHLWMQVTSSAGVSTLASIGVPNLYAHNIAVPFTGGCGGSCFTPQPNWSSVTKIAVRVAHPVNYDGSRTTSWVINQLRATPTGGISPAAPAPTVSAAPAVTGGPDTTLTFDVSFTSGGQPAPVTAQPMTTVGLRASDVTITGTAPGALTATVTGGPARYQVQVRGMTGTGSVAIGIPEGAVRDAWGQPNTAATSAATSFTLAIPPAFDTTPIDATTATAGSPFNATVRTSAGSPPTHITTTGLPAGLTATDHGDGTATISGTPAAGTGGPHPVTFNATNAAGTANRTVTLTVLETPTITSGPVTVTAVEGDPAAATWGISGYPTPTAANLTTLPSDTVPSEFDVTVTGGALTLTYNGDATTEGSFTLARRVTTTAGTVDLEADIVVTRRAAVSSEVDLVVPAGDELNHTVAFTGSTPLTITSDGLPVWMTATDNGDGTATLSGEPTHGDAGTATFTVTATNAAGTTHATHNVTVTAAPGGPTTHNVTAAAGEPLTVRTPIRVGFPTGAVHHSGQPAGITVTDDGTHIMLTSAAVPRSAAGVHTITVTATNTHGTHIAAIELTVEAAPQLDGVTGGFTATVGELFTGTVTATGWPAPTITSSALPGWVNVDATTPGELTLSGTPPAGAGGVTDVTFTATNTRGTDTGTSALAVNEAPVAPTGTTLRFGDDGAAAGTLNWGGHPSPALTATGLSGLTFTDNGDGTATFTNTGITPGTHHIGVVARNSSGERAATITLEVTANVGEPFVSGGEATAGKPVNLTLRAAGWPAPTLGGVGFPAWLTVDDNGDGTARLVGTPPPDSGGTYTVTFTAANAFSTAAVTWGFTVGEAPRLRNDATFTGRVGGAGVSHTLEFAGYPAPALGATHPLPAGLTFTDNGDGTATIAGDPAAGTGGSYGIGVRARNGVGDRTETVTFTILEGVTLPQAPIDGGEIDPGDTVNVTVTAGGYPIPALSVTQPLPAGLTFTDNGDGTAAISGTPEVGAGGVHTIDVIADNGVDTPTHQVVTLEIFEGATFAGADGDDTVDIPSLRTGARLHIPLTVHGWPHPQIATGATPLTAPFTAAGIAVAPASVSIGAHSDLPTGLTFTDNGDGTAAISGTPAAGTGGIHTITVTAANAHGTHTVEVRLTINEPATVSVEDFDGTELVVVADRHTTVEVTTTGLPTATLDVTGTLPAGLAFTDHGDGTAAISGVPARSAAGAHEVTVTADNGVNPVFRATFTVTVDAAPVVTEHPHDRTVAAGEVVTFRAAADGSPAPQVRWELNRGAGWEPAAANDDGTVTVTADRGDTRVRAVFMNRAGEATTNAVTLTGTSAAASAASPATTNGRGAPDDAHPHTGSTLTLMWVAAAAIGFGATTNGTSRLLRRREA